MRRFENILYFADGGPVWIDSPAAALPYRRILAAVDAVDDGSKDSARLVMDLISPVTVPQMA